MIFPFKAARARKGAAVGALVLLLLTAALLVAACGSSSATTTTAADGTTTTAGGATTTAGGATTTAAPGSTDTTGSAGGTVQVIMTNRQYDPQDVTIKVGDTVSWVNQDSPQHDVVADNGEFKSNLFGKGQTFSFTFTAAGTYPYHCSIHPGMAGTVVVQ